MQNSILYVYIPLYPAFEETRCVLWDVGVVVTAHRRRMTFLQGGGAKFVVTSLAGSPPKIVIVKIYNLA